MNTYTDDNFLKEKQKLNSINSLIVIEYIKSTIDILVDFKVNKKIQNFFTNFNFDESSKNFEFDNIQNVLKSQIKINQDSSDKIEKLEINLLQLEKEKNEVKKSYSNLQEVKN